MEVNPLGFLPSAETTKAATSLADNFDDFLLLLTTQLQHQDPLEPLDPNEFTSQLVQFSSVEQAIAQNAKLDNLVALQKSNQVADAVGFIGKTVEVIGGKVELTDGATNTLNYVLSDTADTINITVSDASGNIVRSLLGDTTVGSHQFVWDGNDGNGQAQANGIYTIKVSANTADEEPITLNTSVIGKVDGVSNDDGTLVVTIGGIGYPLGDVLSVRETPTPSA